MKNLKCYSKKIDTIKNIVEENPKLIAYVSKKNKYVLVEWKKNEFEKFEMDNKSFCTCLKIITDEISTRPNKSERFGHWECLDRYECFSLEMKSKVLKMREKIKPREKKINNERALKQLCERYNVPTYMADLFLSEIKLSTDEANAPLRQSASTLGLM